MFLRELHFVCAAARGHCVVVNFRHGPSSGLCLESSKCVRDPDTRVPFNESVLAIYTTVMLPYYSPFSSAKQPSKGCIYPCPCVRLIPLPELQS